MPFGGADSGGPKEHVLDGVQIRQGAAGRSIGTVPTHSCKVQYSNDFNIETV